MSKGSYLQESAVGRGTVQAPKGTSGSEMHFVSLSRDGDEAAFITLVEQYHAALLRLAMAYIPVRAAAEEVVQETCSRTRLWAVFPLHGDTLA